MTKRKIVVALAVFLGVLLSISMHFSKLYAIGQYFDARKIEIGRLYPVPNKKSVLVVAGFGDFRCIA